MRLLIYEWAHYLHDDLYDICKHHGISYDSFRWEFADKNQDDIFLKWFGEHISLKVYSALVSINYFPLLAEAARRSDVKYIAWCYDTPLNVINIEDTLGYPTNYVFLYDRIQYNGYKSKGFDTVYHMPLGVNSRRLARLTVSEKDRRRYGAEASFVGNFYPSRIYELLDLMDDYTRGYVTCAMDVQAKIYGYYLIDELLSDELMQAIRNHILTLRPDTKLRVSREALSFACASEVTRKERLILLNLLGSRFDTKYYSFEKNDSVKNANYMGSLDYVSQMPKVFLCSKINLNPSLRIIQSGVPLRAFDIMGAGGFLLSNWQIELDEMYIGGEDLVMYTSLEDAVEKARFYLQNEDLRLKITASGRAKTLEQHNLDTIFMDICKIVGKEKQ